MDRRTHEGIICSQMVFFCFYDERVLSAIAKFLVPLAERSVPGQKMLHTAQKSGYFFQTQYT